MSGRKDCGISNFSISFTEETNVPTEIYIMIARDTSEDETETKRQEPPYLCGGMSLKLKGLKPK